MARFPILHLGLLVEKVVVNQGGNHGLMFSGQLEIFKSVSVGSAQVSELALTF